MIVPILAALAMGVLSSFGSYFLKRAVSNCSSLYALLCTPQLYIGGFLYVASSLLSYYLLKILPFSVVVPAGSLCYVWTLVLSRYLLSERVSKQRILGVSLIIIGVGCIALSA